MARVLTDGTARDIRQVYEDPLEGVAEQKPATTAVYKDYVAASSGRCGVKANKTMFVCTRPKGHTGLHEACYSSGAPCCLPWGKLPAKHAAPLGGMLAVFAMGAAGTKQCLKTCHCGSDHMCTRERGHIGECEAHIKQGVACCNPWTPEESQE